MKLCKFSISSTKRSSSLDLNHVSTGDFVSIRFDGPVKLNFWIRQSSFLFERTAFFWYRYLRPFLPVHKKRSKQLSAVRLWKYTNPKVDRALAAQGPFTLNYRHILCIERSCDRDFEVWMCGAVFIKVDNDTTGSTWLE